MKKQKNSHHLVNIITSPVYHKAQTCFNPPQWGTVNIAPCNDHRNKAIRGITVQPTERGTNPENQEKYKLYWVVKYDSQP